MSLRRGDVYVWSAGNWVHLWVQNSDEAAVLKNPELYCFDGGIKIRSASFDELVVMRLHQMTPKEIEKARKRATKRFFHHFTRAVGEGEGDG